jgi:hypothetical protein
MSKFNTPATRTQKASPIRTTGQAGTTYEGGPGYERDDKSQLSLMAVSHLGEDTFYEKADDRNIQLRSLVHTVAPADPGWLTEFTRWLRADANMRTAPIMIAAEAVRAMTNAGVPGSRKLVAHSLGRAEEPGELIAYWFATYGRALPNPLRRGIGDWVAANWDEFSALKYDTPSHGIRFADVLALCHPGERKHSSQGEVPRELFGWLVGRRYGRTAPPEQLSMVKANQRLREIAGNYPSYLLDTDKLREAGLTWEDALSLVGSKVNKKDLWESLIPVMNLMAQVRNLRNFDEAGVSDEVAAGIVARLANPNVVRKSQQFPFRFLAAYRNAPSLRWAYPLEMAINHSLLNVPRLDGYTLVLVDRSLSMWGRNISAKSSINWADGAAIFGAAIASRCDRADLVEFSSLNQKVPFTKAESVLKVIERLHKGDDPGGPVGTGTDIPRAVRENLRPEHTRVAIVTDEQSEPGVLPSNVYGYRFGYGNDAAAMPPTKIDDLIPRTTPVYIWNFGGYTHGALPSGQDNRHTMGGLSDAAFRIIPALEAGRNAAWPWEVAPEGVTG